ncbi:MAG: M24 family metallopeptidase, partial [Candidatus Omnitrophica bacterium]|nr:M24 family metallopeptidase [Candidatus Omnitrophota bacterium]
MDVSKIEGLKKRFDKILIVLETTEPVDICFCIPEHEFLLRQRKTYQAIRGKGVDVGIVFSDQHYNGDVPYLGGNTNITIEQVAGVIGENGFHIIAGLEGGYVSEQLAKRASAKVHKVEMLKLADEQYPINAERLEDVIEEAAKGKVKKIGLLTPREVIPYRFVKYLEDVYGAANVVDIQEVYYKIKYEKSDNEMRLIRDASHIADAMMRGMLAVLAPGMLETQVAAWGYFIAKELGAEEMGWDIMVGANEANRTLIGKALNREIKKGDYVHLGVAPKRDGLNSCIRRSVIAVEDPSEVTNEQKYWFNLVEEAYRVGFQKYCEVAEKNLPAYLQEKALVDYFASKSEEVSAKIGKKINLERLKPYTGTHNAGYTECQEFYGAITLSSSEPLGNQIVTMLDVALRGIGDRWDDVVIPGFDYLVIENTIGKFFNEIFICNKAALKILRLRVLKKIKSKSSSFSTLLYFTLLFITFIIITSSNSFSLDLIFTNSKLEDILMEISNQEKINIFYPSKVGTFTTSINMRKIDLEVAFQKLLLPLGLDYEKVDNSTYIIYERNNSKPKFLGIYEAQYVNPVVLNEILEITGIESYVFGGKIYYYTSGNKSLEEILNQLKQFDRKEKLEYKVLLITIKHYVEDDILKSTYRGNY